MESAIVATVIIDCGLNVIYHGGIAVCVNPEHTLGMLQVPRDHQEVARLEGRYKSQGGLKEGMVVELANGESAMVVDLKDDAVQIDANNMMAGKTRTFEITLQRIEPAKM